MKARRATQLVLSLVALVGGVSCLDVSGAGAADSQIRIGNASGQTLSLFLDDQLQIDDSHQLNISLMQVPSGDHTLTARTSGGIDTPLPLTAPPGGSINTYAYTTASGTLALVLLDTIEVPTGNTALVRAINLSKIVGNVDVYASLLGGSASTLLAPSISYLSTTPYASKAANDSLEVYLTTAGTTTKIRTTGGFPVGPGDRRTVVLIDSGLVQVFRILPN